MSRRVMLASLLLAFSVFVVAALVPVWVVPIVVLVGFCVGAALIELLLGGDQ